MEYGGPGHTVASPWPVDRCVWSKGTARRGGLGLRAKKRVLGTVEAIYTSGQTDSREPVPKRVGRPGTWVSGGLTDGSKGPVLDHKLGTEGKVTEAQVLQLFLSCFKAVVGKKDDGRIISADRDSGSLRTRNAFSWFV